MKIGIYVNINRDLECKTAKKFIEILLSKGVQVLVCCGAEQYINLPSYPLDEVAKSADVLVVFGGDGTMLSVARRVVKSGIALLGVNKGRLGFLTECEDSDLQLVADSLINGEYKLDKRAMLQISTQCGEYLALNEVTVSRMMSKRTIEVAISIDGGLCDIVRGDGVIVSTPTGSTAYALSCGGAILSPNLRAIGVTAICPHSLNSRPIVVDDSSIIILAVQNCNEDVVVCVDGECLPTFKGDVVVQVKKSECYTKLIRLNDNNFYSRLLQKMSGWNMIGGKQTDENE